MSCIRDNREGMHFPNPYLFLLCFPPPSSLLPFSPSPLLLPPSFLFIPPSSLPLLFPPPSHCPFLSPFTLPTPLSPFSILLSSLTPFCSRCAQAPRDVPPHEPRIRTPTPPQPPPSRREERSREDLLLRQGLQMMT